MKQMVTVLIQPRWTEWRQQSALRSGRHRFRQYCWALNNTRWADGKGSLNQSKLLDYKEIRDWLSDTYIELRGEYRIRIDYAEFERVVLQANEIGDERRIYRSSGWGAAGCPYRDGWAYRRNPDHSPKPDQDDSWYIETRHKRDKARHGWGSMSHGCARRRFWVKQSARDHRAWVKREIRNKNWDLFDRGAQDQEYQQFADPWLWD